MKGPRMMTVEMVSKQLDRMNRSEWEATKTRFRCWI